MPAGMTCMAWLLCLTIIAHVHAIGPMLYTDGTKIMLHGELNADGVDLVATILQLSANVSSLQIHLQNVQQSNTAFQTQLNQSNESINALQSVAMESNNTVQQQQQLISAQQSQILSLQQSIATSQTQILSNCTVSQNLTSSLQEQVSSLQQSRSWASLYKSQQGTCMGGVGVPYYWDSFYTNNQQSSISCNSTYCMLTGPGVFHLSASVSIIQVPIDNSNFRYVWGVVGQATYNGKFGQSYFGNTQGAQTAFIADGICDVPSNSTVAVFLSTQSSDCGSSDLIGDGNAFIQQLS